MIAVKENKEIKILEMQKEAYLEKGYKILDKDLKVIASPSTKEEMISKLEKQVEDLNKEKTSLKAENEKLEKQVEDLNKEISKLKK